MPAGSKLVTAFKDGVYFPAMVLAGQAPRAAVARRLKRMLGADVTLWPTGSTPYGEKFRAQWFDKKSATFKESVIEIWRL